MSWVASSPVSSSALRVFARSAERLAFFSIKSRRNFSSSFFGILTGRAVVVGMASFSFFPSLPGPRARFRTRDDNREFRQTPVRNPAFLPVASCQLSVVSCQLSVLGSETSENLNQNLRLSPTTYHLPPITYHLSPVM